MQVTTPVHRDLAAFKRGPDSGDALPTTVVTTLTVTQDQFGELGTLPPSLTSLEVVFTKEIDCNDTVKQVAEAIAALPSLRSLTVIDTTQAEEQLPHGRVAFYGTDASRYLIEMALTSRTITTLVVERCFRMEELQKFSNQLSTNSTLTTLKWVKQPVMGEGARLMCEPLLRHSSLKMVEFQDCVFALYGKEFVQAVARKNHALTLVVVLS